jgi:NAD+ kinase
VSFAPRQRVAVAYPPRLDGAEALAHSLSARCEAAGLESWVDPLPDTADESASSGSFATRLPRADLLVCVGGDGTVLHVSGFAAQTGTPVFGVRLGRLGFLAETPAEGVEAALDLVLAGEARMERRSMAMARCGDDEPLHALNDVVIGRPGLGRTVSIGASIDGVLLAEYRADAVVVSTATGATGYAFSVGGPILSPQSDDLILVPVAPHLTHSNAVVVPGDTTIRLELARGEALLSVDGMHERHVDPGAIVEVSHSPRSVEFVRLGGQHQFYANLAERLGWLRHDHDLNPRDSR